MTGGGGILPSVIARNILSGRLARLAQAGLVERP